MKNYIIIIASALLASACNQAELDKATRERDSLLTVSSSLQSTVTARDSSLTEFMTTLDEVERNLDTVAQRQHIITVASDKPGELKKTQKERINSEILAINNLMEENRIKLEELNKKLKSSKSKNVQLEKMLATLNSQISQKDLELTALNEKLANLNAEVATLKLCMDTLIASNNAHQQTIAANTMALHTAYYVVGKSKELQDKNLIDRTGGLLGMGKTSKLNSDIDNSKFTRIDYTQVTDIEVNSPVKIVTSHPTNSYKLDLDGKVKNLVKRIVITDPEKFWSASKYLVVVKD